MIPPSDFGFMVLTPAGTPDPALAIAGSRAGAVGVLNLELAADPSSSLGALEMLTSHGRGRRGVLLEGEAEELLGAVLAQPGHGLEAILLTASAPGRLGDLVERVHSAGLRAFLVVTSIDEVRV